MFGLLMQASCCWFRGIKPKLVMGWPFMALCKSRELIPLTLRQQVTQGRVELFRATRQVAPRLVFLSLAAFEP